MTCIVEVRPPDEDRWVYFLSLALISLASFFVHGRFTYLVNPHTYAWISISSVFPQMDQLLQWIGSTDRYSFNLMLNSEMWLCCGSLGPFLRDSILRSLLFQLSNSFLKFASAEHWSTLEVSTINEVEMHRYVGRASDCYAIFIDTCLL